jgi:hypothetical protein
MSTAVLYTNTDAIRAAVGISSTEIPDSMITDQQMERQVKTALYSWLPTYPALYTAGDAEEATDEQVYVKDLLVLYCTYFGAVRLVEMIMAMRQRVSDGKSEVERFNIDWLSLLEALKGRLDEIQDLLEEVINPSHGGPSYFGKAVPDYDPVTNT